MKNIRSLGSGLLSTSQLFSIVALAIAGGLMVWAALPLAVGWSAHAVVSGSMTPQVEIGDVLVSQPADTDKLRAGMVILFKDPADPSRILSHRIKEVNADGTFVTHGDANQSNDPMPVPAANVLGVARLRIPWIGYPAVWFGTGRYELVLLTLAALITATALAVWPDGEQEDEEGPAVTDVAEPWPWLVPLRTQESHHVS